MSVVVGDRYSWGDGYEYIVTEIDGDNVTVIQVGTSWSEVYDKAELATGYWASHRLSEYINIRGERVAVPPAKVDVVNHPSHYKFDNGVEVIDLTEQLNFNCGNIVKYTARAGRKDATKQLEDLRKAEFYIKREIKRVEAAGEVV